MMRTLKCLLSLLFVSICVPLYAQVPYFNFNGAADVNFSYPPRGSGGRAIVHADGNVLNLNYGGDFTGGTRIGNDFFVWNDGRVGLGVPNAIVKLQVNGTTIIGNSTGNNYNENLRLPSSNAGYSCIALGAIAGDSGTGLGQWSSSFAFITPKSIPLAFTK